jgi:molybdenum cofactor biosynthesis enzyme MoaA
MKLAVDERDQAVPEAIGILRRAHLSSQLRFAPEESPFGTVFADITHRCNMACRNCYIPVRDLPDLPVDWLYGILARLPRRVRVRLVGAEPTVREDLPEIIAQVRALGHIPVVLTNGLKLGRRAYVKALKAAGLRTVYLSLNGGLRDDLYEAVDDMACAKRKLAALHNLLNEKMNVTVGMILVPGVNANHLSEFLPWLLARGIRDIHLRSVGPMGRHMEDTPFTLDGLEECLRLSLGARASELHFSAAVGSSRDFHLGRIGIQLTAWPDLGSRERGRITPEGFVEPMFESIQSNAFHY